MLTTVSQEVFMVKTRFKFCSVLSRYYFYLKCEQKGRNGFKHKDIECSPPPIELVSPSCYREGAYWVRATPPYTSEAKGYVFVNNCWYWWGGLNGGNVEPWNSPNALSIKDTEVLKYMNLHLNKYLTKEAKDILHYWRVREKCRDARRDTLKRRLKSSRK